MQEQGQETIESLAELVHRSSRFTSPSLWNDTKQPPVPPLGTPAELLANGASLSQTFARFAGHPPLERAQRWKPERIDSHAREDMQPLPAAADRVGYYGTDDLAYWLSGLGDCLLLADIANELERPLAAGGQFLDFGCATGRVLRHFKSAAPDVDAFGIDLCRQHVAWARQYLDAPVLQGTSLPTLPFADASVDVIFAGSVFTHINDFEEAWLAELRRVMTPNGFALLTFHSEQVWEEMRINPQHPIRRATLEIRHRLDPSGIEPVTDADLNSEMPAERIALEAVDWPSANVFHSHSHVRDQWGQFFDVKRILKRSHGYQDSVILLRR